MASGVMVLLLGEGTKLSNYLSSESKRYEATVSFGISTNTWDAEGELARRSPLSPEALEAQVREGLAAALDEERQRTLQTPPAFSAIKVKGVRSYTSAREGQEVHLEPRSVQVKDLIQLSEGEWIATENFGTQLNFRFELTVSKGYYVRAFAQDLGKTLGVPAHLSALRRTASGNFDISEAINWPLADISPPLIPLLDAARRCLPQCVLTEEGRDKASKGQLLTAADFAELADSSEVCLWLGPNGQAVALGQMDREYYRVKRGFDPEQLSTL